MAIERCTLCANSHNSGDIPKYLPAGLTQYVLNNFSKKSPPYHVTRDDVSSPLQRLEVEQITGHQSIRGQSGVIAALYKTHWAGLSEPSWKREMDFHLSRPHVLRYWTGSSDQHRQTNRLYRRMRIRAAQRELSRNNGERFLAPGYACVTRADWLRRYHDTVPPMGAHVWYRRETMGCDGLEKLARAQSRTGYIWFDFWMTRGRSSFLFPRRATRLRRGPYQALGACKFTSPVHFLGGSNLT